MLLLLAVVGRLLLLLFGLRLRLSSSRLAIGWIPAYNHLRRRDCRRRLLGLGGRLVREAAIVLRERRIAEDELRAARRDGTAEEQLVAILEHKRRVKSRGLDALAGSAAFRHYKNAVGAAVLEHEPLVRLRPLDCRVHTRDELAQRVVACTRRAAHDKG